MPNLEFIQLTLLNWFPIRLVKYGVKGFFSKSTVSVTSWWHFICFYISKMEKFSRKTWRNRVNFRPGLKWYSGFRFCLTHFSPVSHFYTPWKRQKIFGFLTFQGVQKHDTGLKWVKNVHCSIIFLNIVTPLLSY